MAIYITSPQAGYQAPLDISSTQNHALGTIVKAQDANTGSGGQGAMELIYLQGVANTIQGSVVQYNSRDGVTILVPTTSKNTGAPVAVAMVANNTTGSYAWYQIQGVALVAKGVVDFPTNSPVYMSTATAGYVTVTASSGNQLLGARTANSASVSSTTSTIYIEIDRPHLQGIYN